MVGRLRWRGLASCNCFLAAVMAHFGNDSFDVSVEQVVFRFQRGRNEMLHVRHAECINQRERHPASRGRLVPGFKTNTYLEDRIARRPRERVRCC